MTEADLVLRLQARTGLSEAAVRSVLWQARGLDWRIVRTRQVIEDGENPSWTDPPTETVSVIEEWGP